MLGFLVSILLGVSLVSARSLVDIPTVLFPDSTWVINTNYIAASSDSFYAEYHFDALCNMQVTFQEIYCQGKSANATIRNRDNSTDVRVVQMKSPVSEYSCNTNIQDAGVAVFDQRYSKGSAVLAPGRYTISMTLKDGSNPRLIQGFRAFAVKASVTDAQLVLASTCRHRKDPRADVSAQD